MRGTLEMNSFASRLKHMASWLISSGLFKFWDSNDQDIYPFATPLEVTQEFHRNLVQAHDACCKALRELCFRLKKDPEKARELLKFTSGLEEEFFFLDAGYIDGVPWCRSDTAVDCEGNLWVLEVNTGCPGGELDPALIALAYREAGGKKDPSGIFLDPRDDSLQVILKCYREFRNSAPFLPEIPTIALVTSRAQAPFLLPESIGIAKKYRDKGFKVLVGDISDLACGDGGLVLFNTHVHLIYRKFSTQSLRLRLEEPGRFGEKEARGAKLLWEAVASAKVCLVNPLGSTFLQDKGLLEVIRDEYPNIKGWIPQTVILDERLQEDHPELVEEVSMSGKFVLKRRNSFSGRHVIMDQRLIQDEVPRILSTEPGKWVAQRRIQPSKRWFAAFCRGETRSGEFPFVISPFGVSAFVRVGLSGNDDIPINAHNGSAETFLLISQVNGNPSLLRKQDDHGEDQGGCR